MADDQQRRLLWQQEETQAPEASTVLSPTRPQPFQQQSELLAPDMLEVAAASDVFAAQLQRLAETMPRQPRSAWNPVAPIGWIIALFVLFLGNWPLSLCCGALAILAGRHKKLEAQYAQAQAALNLAEYNVEWLGPLTLALESPCVALRPAAAQMLLRVLPLVTAKDFARLDSYQRGCLHRRLIPNEEMDPTLALMILDMVEQFGNAEAIPYIERLSYAMTSSGERRRVSALAQAVLPRLRIRLQREAEAKRGGVKGEASEEKQVAEITPQTRWAVTQVEAQLKLLDQEKKKHQQPGMRIGFLIASWCVIVPYTATQVWLSLVQGSWLEALIWGLLTILGTQLHRFCLSPKQTEAARKLAMHEDVRGVGPLAEALEWPDQDIQMVASRALTRLLPRMQATDAGLLNAGQRASLYRKLHPYQSGHQTDFQLAILKALEQIGDEAAVPHVRRLAGSIALTSRQKQVKQAAIDCLPYLNERAAQLRVSQTLLRASSATATTADMLLRPVDNAAAAPPEQLLRATTGQDAGA